MLKVRGLYALKNLQQIILLGITKYRQESLRSVCTSERLVQQL